MHSFVEGRPELKCKPLCFPMKDPCAKGGANGVDNALPRLADFFVVLRFYELHNIWKWHASLKLQTFVLPNEG